MLNCSKFVIKPIVMNLLFNIAILSTGNKLTCDCRLSWLHKLRNDTKSKRLKASLDRLNCIMDTKVKTSVPNIKVELINVISKDLKKDVEKDKIYEEIGEEDDENFYDEMQDQDHSGDNKIEYRRKLLEIPTEMLPCPKKLSYEESFSPPTQDEVRYYQSSSSKNNLDIVLMFIVVVNVL